MLWQVLLKKNQETTHSDLGLIFNPELLQNLSSYLLILFYLILSLDLALRRCDVVNTAIGMEQLGLLSLSLIYRLVLPEHQNAQHKPIRCITVTCCAITVIRKCRKCLSKKNLDFFSTWIDLLAIGNKLVPFYIYVEHSPLYIISAFRRKVEMTEH